MEAAWRPTTKAQNADENAFPKYRICAIFFSVHGMSAEASCDIEEKPRGMRFRHFGSRPKGRREFFIFPL
jgi:hypothetical protein